LIEGKTAMNIAVIGAVGGCGKTAIARALAEDFGLTYCSIDPLDQGDEPFSAGATGCVIDCPPEVTPLMETALQCADRVILVLKMPHLVSSGMISSATKLISAQTAICRPDTRTEIDNFCTL
jgi:MinD superfamily P-loop ATPase